MWESKRVKYIYDLKYPFKSSEITYIYSFISHERAKYPAFYYKLTHFQS